MRSGRRAILEPLENQIGTQIIISAIAVHSALGPGLLENTYQLFLAHELAKHDLRARAQVGLSIRYGDLLVKNAYRIDVLEENLIVIEVKSVDANLPVHRAQLLSYMRLGAYKLGYLLNFNVAQMRNGIVRLAIGL